MSFSGRSVYRSYAPHERNAGSELFEPALVFCRSSLLARSLAGAMRGAEAAVVVIVQLRLQWPSHLPRAAARLHVAAHFVGLEPVVGGRDGVRDAARLVANEDVQPGGHELAEEIDGLVAAGRGAH